MTTKGATVALPLETHPAIGEFGGDDRFYINAPKKCRAFVAARAVTSTHGGARRGNADTGITIVQAAKAVRVSARYVRLVRQVLATDCQALIAGVEHDRIAIDRALYLARLVSAPAELARCVARYRPQSHWSEWDGDILNALEPEQAARLRRERAEEKQRRHARLSALAAQLQAEGHPDAALYARAFGGARHG